jgi:hypothetical protein
LYLQTRGDLKGWDYQSPPRRVGDVIGRGLPKFGEYEKERRKVKNSGGWEMTGNSLLLKPRLKE